MGLLDTLINTLKYDTVSESNTWNPASNNIDKQSFEQNATSQKNSEIAQIRNEIRLIDTELESAYTQIGKRYLEKVIKTGDYCGVEIQDILRVMQPKATKKKELEQRIITLEKEIRQSDFLREKELANAEYENEKSKLDKALAMDVIDQSDYEQRLSVARKKYDNFEEIRRIRQQFDMNLISATERDERIYKLTN